MCVKYYKLHYLNLSITLKMLAIGYELMNFNPELQCTMSLKQKQKTTSKNYIGKVTECGVILFKKGMEEMLVVFQHVSSKWGFPKGYMTNAEQYNKEYFKCAKRELLEETGIDLRATHHSKYGTLIIGNKLFYIIELKSTLDEINIIDNNEISEARWIQRQNLLSFINENDCNATLNKLF